MHFIEGYESITVLTVQEKEIIPCVMKCIEVLFAAYNEFMKKEGCEAGWGELEISEG